MWPYNNSHSSVSIKMTSTRAVTQYRIVIGTRHTGLQLHKRKSDHKTSRHYEWWWNLLMIHIDGKCKWQKEGNWVNIQWPKIHWYLVFWWTGICRNFLSYCLCLHQEIPTETTKQRSNIKEFRTGCYHGKRSFRYIHGTVVVIIASVLL